jgi:quinol monooxygenase YgiN
MTEACRSSSIGRTEPAWQGPDKACADGVADRTPRMPTRTCDRWSWCCPCRKPAREPLRDCFKPMKSASPRTCQMKSAPHDRGDCTTVLRPQRKPQTWGEQVAGPGRVDTWHVVCWPRGGQSSDAVDTRVEIPSSSLCSPYVRTSEEWLSLVADFTTATPAEPGNIFVEWSRSVDNPNQFALAEAFSDRKAGEAHVNSDHLKKVMASWGCCPRLPDKGPGERCWCATNLSGPAMCPDRPCTSGDTREELPARRWSVFGFSAEAT